jgi:hypothetical protein
MEMLLRASRTMEHKLPASTKAMVRLLRGCGAAALVSFGTRGTNGARQAQEFRSTALRSSSRESCALRRQSRRVRANAS